MRLHPMNGISMPVEYELAHTCARWVSTAATIELSAVVFTGSFLQTVLPMLHGTRLPRLISDFNRISALSGNDNITLHIGLSVIYWRDRPSPEVGSRRACFCVGVFRV
jgi:hypothetical protein